LQRAWRLFKVVPVSLQEAIAVFNKTCQASHPDMLDGAMKAQLSCLALALFASSICLAAEPGATSGHIIEHDKDVTEAQAGPHEGGGETTAYNFFAGAEGLEWNFRKRALHPGSAIGYHEQHQDEIYYVLSGQGELTMNGVSSTVGPGTAILTRPGDSHGLRQVGDEDLVIMVAYPRITE